MTQPHDIDNTVVAHEGQIDATRATADVQHLLAGQVMATDDARNLIRAARRQKACAPDGFQHLDQARRIMFDGHDVPFGVGPGWGRIVGRPWRS